MQRSVKPAPPAAPAASTATAEPIPHATVLPVLPVSDLVLFPAMIAPLVVSTARSMKLVEEVAAGDRMFIAALQKKREQPDDQVSGSDLHDHGCVARLLRTMKFPDSTVRVLVQGLHRCTLDNYEPGSAYLKARFRTLPEQMMNHSRSSRKDGLHLEALARSVSLRFQEVITLSPSLPEELKVALFNMEDPAKLADLVAANLNMDIADRQRLLAEHRVEARLETLTQLLNREHEVLKLGNEIQAKVSATFSKSQREFYLREQLKAIRSELGEQDPQSADQEYMRKKITEAKLPEAAQKVADKELSRLQTIPSASPEYGIIRTYLELLAELPWNTVSPDALNLSTAQEILNHDHFGLEKVKARILEFLAVMKLQGSAHGPILCFAGPPGVGKTSLGQSIARALDRKFIRLSLGGMRDEAEIRGHRRTYVGAMPGRIIQELRRAGTKNPVFMLDEVDKLGSDFRGDPASALLEVLDPEQNKSFSDHYLEVPFDLSRVLFITTANVLDAIPPPLRDRMEILELSSYTTPEKVQIAQRHLISKQMKANGLETVPISFLPAALEEIITGFTREAGVRTLEREIASCLRKVARRVVDSPVFSTTGGRAGETKAPKKNTDIPGGHIVTPKLVRRWLGTRKFISEISGKKNAPGIATGLAWTPAGGEILFIEAASMPGKGNVILTGSLGDVMKESARTALSLLRARGAPWGWAADFAEKNDLHVHVPSGAIPKDGPSAGLAIAMALASLGLHRAIPADLAMTGEITLRGRVLPVGGIKEKVLGAIRAGVHTLLMPERNRADLKDVPADLRKNIRFIFVGNLDFALRAAGLFPLKPAPKSVKRAAAAAPPVSA